MVERMTAMEIMKITNQKKGVVDQFRSELQRHMIIGNNQGITIKELDVFKESVRIKEDENITWAQAINKAIINNYDIKVPFYWSFRAIIEDLVWKIKEKKVSVQYLDLNKRDNFHMFCIIIDNFIYISKSVSEFEGSFGTDGNPNISYMCKGENDIYYIIGKLNQVTKEEDIHVFYNEGLEFNIMKCQYIGGGSCSYGISGDLKSSCWNACHSNDF